MIIALPNQCLGITLVAVSTIHTFCVPAQRGKLCSIKGVELSIIPPSPRNTFIMVVCLHLSQIPPGSFELGIDRRAGMVPVL
jgi:hypothetical protein